MNYDAIISKVKAFMDEVGAIDGTLLIEDDTEKPVDMLISASLASAWRSFALLCPLYLLPSKAGANVTATTKTATIPIPTDFIRLASVKMSSWVRDLSDLYPAEGNLYAMQSNDFTKGTPTRPLAFVKNGTIECYSGAANGETTTFKYVADVVFDAKVTDELIPANIAHAFCYHVAGNVYDILNSQAAKTMYANRDALCV